MKNSSKSLSAALAAVTLLVFGCNDGITLLDASQNQGTTGSTTSPSKPTENTSGATDIQLKILEQTNAYRAQNGAAPLTYNAQLSRSAQAFAEQMATQGFFSHTAPDGTGPGTRIAATGYSAYTWGENIAYGYSTPDATMNGWINSPGHRANIVNGSFKELGVGYAISSGGTAYWVQDFGAQ